MRYLIFLLLIGFYGNLLAQQVDSTEIQFFKILNDEVNEGIFKGCDIYNDGYFAVGSSANENGIIYLSLKKYSFQGELLADIELDNRDTGGYGQINYGRCLAQINEIEWVLAYSSDNGNDKDIRVIKFNLDGEVLWQTDLGGNYFDRAKKILIIEDNIILIGESYINSNISKGYCAFINSSTGNLVWERVEEDLPIFSNSTHSGGVIYNNIILLSGRRELESENYPYIKKVSIENGELIDEIIYDENIGCACNIREIENQTNLFHFTSCYLDIETVKVARVDEQLDVLWEKTYPIEDYLNNPPINPIIYEDSRFVSLHEYDIVTEFGLRSQIEMFGLDPEGNIEFVTKIPTDTTKEVYVRDLRKTPDGGYLIAGYEHFPSPQRGWLIKTDSLGNCCQLPNCDSVAYVIDTVFTNNFDITMARAGLQVFPNPIQENGFVNIVLNDSYDAIESSQIFSIDGKQLFFSANDNTNQVPTNNLVAGIYMLKIRTRKGVTYTRRLVVK